MKEDIISFETAKLAKEKGFNERCCNYYISAFGKHFKEKDGELNSFYVEDEGGIVKNSFYFRKNSSGQPHIVIAPTQSLLQKWFREEYSIFVEVFYDKPEWRTTLQDKDENILGDGYDQPENMTYEQALELGLREALKLI